MTDTKANFFNVTYCAHSTEVVRHVENSISTGHPFAAAFLDIKMDGQKDGETVLKNIQQMIKPMVDKLKMTNVSTRQRNLITAIESNLEEIISPFLGRLDSKYIKLTPIEIQVANGVKTGLTNKENAELLGVSKGTVTIHRHNLRKKLGILNKKINLRTHLLDTS